VDTLRGQERDAAGLVVDAATDAQRSVWLARCG
jgi:hypothetical protein